MKIVGQVALERMGTSVARGGICGCRMARMRGWELGSTRRLHLHIIIYYLRSATKDTKDEQSLAKIPIKLRYSREPL